jgi:hypothetical protein
MSRCERSSPRSAPYRSSPTASRTTMHPCAWPRSVSGMSMVASESVSSPISERRGFASRWMSASATRSSRNRSGSSTRACSTCRGHGSEPTDKKRPSPRSSTRWSSSARRTAACVTSSTFTRWQRTDRSTEPSLPAPLPQHSPGDRPRCRPRSPLALTLEFAAIEGKPAQWNAFARRLPAASAPVDLASVLRGVAAFAGPVLLAVGRQEPYDRTWLPGGPWLQAG